MWVIGAVVLWGIYMSNGWVTHMSFFRSGGDSDGGGWY